MTDIYNIKPQVTHPSAGAEPSIRELLYKYYFGGGFDHDSAVVLTEIYIALLNKENLK